MLFLSPLYLTLASTLTGAPLPLPATPGVDTTPKAPATNAPKPEGLVLDSANAKKYVDAFKKIKQKLGGNQALNDKFKQAINTLETSTCAKALGELPQVGPIVKETGWTIPQFAELTQVVRYSFIVLAGEQQGNAAMMKMFIKHLESTIPSIEAAVAALKPHFQTLDGYKVFEKPNFRKP